MSTQSAASASAGGRLFVDFALFGPAVADGEYYRLLTSGFLHSGFLHVGFNMYILWFLGNLLEPSLGPVRFAGLYLASLLTGSFVAMLLSPDAATIGASGAIFGLMGAAFVMQRARGVDPMQSGIGPMILINLALGFIIPNVSVAGHVGGLIGGALVGLPDGPGGSLPPAVAAGGGGGAGGRGRGRRVHRGRVDRVDLFLHPRCAEPGSDVSARCRPELLALKG